MPYELKHSDSLGRGMSRIVVNEVDSILKQLNAKNADISEPIHETRKSIKKIRAIVRLLRHALGSKAYQFENAFFRDAGHQLSDARDAQILIDSAEKLRTMERAPTRMLATMKKEYAGHRDALHALLLAKGVLHHLSEVLDTSRKRIKRWPNASWGEVSVALQRSYKTGRDALQSAKDKPAFETYHELRKRIKDMNYQSRLLEPLWPEVMSLLGDQTHTLSDRLGDDHDFGVLQALVKRNPPRGTNADVKRLLELIDEQHKNLRSEAEELSAQVYSDRPRDFLAKLEALWAAG